MHKILKTGDESTIKVSELMTTTPCGWWADSSIGIE